MKVTEAFEFMKTIINNGKSKKFSVNKIRKTIDDYLNILMIQRCISKTGFILLSKVVSRLDDIVKNKVTADEVFISSLSEIDEEVFQEKRSFVRNIPYRSATCVSSSRCGEVESETCSHRSLRKKDCGSSDDYKCGIPGGGGRC